MPDSRALLVKVTLQANLQAAINNILADKTRRYLAFLVSQAVEKITVHVQEPSITTLRIQRCPQENDNHGQLEINGMSTSPWRKN